MKISEETHDNQMEEVIPHKEDDKAAELLLTALKRSQLIQAEFFDMEYDEQLKYAASLILDKQFLRAVIKHQGRKLMDTEEELKIKESELKRAQDRIVELSKPH